MQNPYELEHYHKIGSGGFADVYVSLPTHAETIHVLKIPLTNSSRMRELFGKEHEILCTLRAKPHRNIVQFLNGVYDSCEDQFLNRTYFKFEYVNESDLLSFLMKFQGKKLSVPSYLYAYLLLGITQGLAHLHDNCSVIHRDIKPENILIQSKEGRFVVPKIADFGLSCGFLPSDPVVTDHILGSIEYVAPEAIKHNQYTTRSDIYSLAVLMYTMLIFHTPFQGIFEQEQETRKVLKHVSLGYREKIYNMPHVLPVFQEMIHDCLAPDPTDRPCAQDVARALEYILGNAPLSKQPLPLVCIPKGDRAFGKWGCSHRFFDRFSTPIEADNTLEERVVP